MLMADSHVGRSSAKLRSIWNEGDGFVINIGEAEVHGFVKILGRGRIIFAQETERFVEGLGANRVSASFI